MLEPTTLLIFINTRNRKRVFVHRRRIAGDPGLRTNVCLLGDVFKIASITDIWVPSQGKKLLDDARTVLEGVENLPDGIDVPTKPMDDRIPVERVMIVSVE